MVITYQGLEFFKVQFGDTILALNPVSKDSKVKTARFGADIALVSLKHEDMNGVLSVSLGDRIPFAVEGPGEYEIKGIFIKGVAAESLYGGEKKINTIYFITIENMNLCFLGALAAGALSTETKEAFPNIDILFVPIGGDGVLSASEAYKLAVSLEPKLIIPMHYGGAGEKNALKTFLKEEGAEDVKPIEKLTVKKKDLEGKEGDIVILEAGGA